MPPGLCLGRKPLDRKSISALQSRHLPPGSISYTPVSWSLLNESRHATPFPSRHGLGPVASSVDSKPSILLSPCCLHRGRLSERTGLCRSYDLQAQGCTNHGDSRPLASLGRIALLLASACVALLCAA